MNWLKKNSDRCHRFSREIKSLLNGRRWHDLDRNLRSLERQITKAILSIKQEQALKLATKKGFDGVPTLDSLNRLRVRKPIRKSTLAVVTVLPPQQTGIALASMLTFREAAFPIDIFRNSKITMTT